MKAAFLEFTFTASVGIAGAVTSTAHALKTEILRVVEAAWLERSAAIYRLRTERMIDFADQRLRIGPDGAVWMTPEDLHFFRHFNPIFLRAMEKELSFLPPAQAEREAPTAHRAARAGSVGLAAAAVVRRRRRGAASSLTTKSRPDNRKS